jgi:magnesium transporter
MSEAQPRIAEIPVIDRPTEHGLVACTLYQDGKRIRDVDINACGALVRHDNEIIWVGLYEPDESLLVVLQQQFGLHDLLIEDAHQAHQRPKLDVYGDVLFVAVRTAQLIDGAVRLGETHIVIGKGYVISIRHGPSVSYAEVRKRCERAPELLRLGESFILYAILDFIADNYFPVVDAIEEEIEGIEKELFSVNAGVDKTERIYRLRTELQGMRRAVTPMIELCNRLDRHEFPAKATTIQPYLRDLQDHVLSASEAIGELRERLASAFEASLLLASARQNDIVKKLASWAAILAVPTAIAGIYGMNFKWMPELDWEFGYPVVMGGMFTLCGFLYYRFKRSSWL